MAPIRCGRERFGNISINGLAYAGSLFVRDAEELQLLPRLAPWGC